MKVVPSILFLLCSTDGSLSFSPHLPHERTSHDLSSRRDGYSSKTGLFYAPNFMESDPFDNDAFLANGSPYLHRVNGFRGGDTTGNNNNSNNKEYGSLNSLSVSELKRILNDRSIDFRDCLEKRDLIERILTTPASSSYRHSNTDAKDGLSQEENRVVNTFMRASPSVAYIQTVVGGVKRNGFSLKGEFSRIIILCCSYQFGI